MKIVITGGPSAGKTTIAEVVARTYQMALVPESASILFRGGFPRSTFGPGLCYQQMAIYQVQRQLENVVEDKNPGQILLCDRGTLDGLAYWPESSETFFHLLNTTMDKELSRYNWVINLETVEKALYVTNSLRIENPVQALDLNLKIKEVWGHHPHFICIENSLDFDKKIKRVLTAVQMILSGSSPTTIRDELRAAG